METLEKELITLEWAAVLTGSQQDRHRVSLKQKEYKDVAEEAARASIRATTTGYMKLGTRQVNC